MSPAAGTTGIGLANEIQSLLNSAQGSHRLREGAAVDYLLPYYLAVYLGVISK